MGFFGDFASSFGGDILSGGLGMIEGNQDRKAQQGIANAQETQNRLNAAESKREFDSNQAMQKEFAQNSVQWKIQDAEKAGISPLAALGAGTSYSPVVSVFDEKPIPPVMSQGQNLTHNLSKMGQDIIQSIARGQSDHDRRMTAEAETRAHLENDLIREQIINARLNRPGTPPSNPAIPSASRTLMNEDGTTVQVPTYDTLYVPGGKWEWALNNRLIPSIKDLYGNLIRLPMEKIKNEIKSEWGGQ